AAPSPPHPLSLHDALPIFRLISATSDMWPLTSFVVDGCEDVSLAFDQIHLGDQAKAIGGKGDRARVNALLLSSFFGIWQASAGLINPSVHVPPFDSI